MSINETTQKRTSSDGCPQSEYSEFILDSVHERLTSMEGGKRRNDTLLLWAILYELRKLSAGKAVQGEYVDFSDVPNPQM